MEDRDVLAIEKQLRQVNRLLALTLIKDFDSQVKRIDYLYSIGLNTEEIVDLLGSQRGRLNLEQYAKQYEIFGVLREADFKNKDIASLFGITENNVKSTLSHYKEEIKRLINGRAKL